MIPSIEIFFWIKNLEILLITAVYRTPKGNNKLFKNFCKDFLNKQEMSNKAAFLLGDFNLNASDYDTNKEVKDFFNLVFQNGFLSLVQRPTRVTRTSATVIDHILTNRVLENKIQSGIIKTDISDHFPIFTVFKTNETWSLEKTKFIKRDISSENIDTFKFLLENLKWDNILPQIKHIRPSSLFFLICMILPFQKEKLKLKLNIYSLPG